MSYEQKYKKYKKMYLNLKNPQRGGNDNKVITEKTSEEYQQLVNKLKTFCSEKIPADQLKDKMKSLYDTLQQANLSEYNLPNIFGKKENIDKINFEKLHSRACTLLLNHVVPYLEKRKDLQEKLVYAFRQIDLKGGSIEIDKYLDYAREYDLMDESAEAVLRNYQATAEQLAEHYNIEALKHKVLLSGHVQATGLVSKTGKICKSPCNERESFWKGKYWACDTDPYKSMFFEKKWDYCEKPFYSPANLDIASSTTKIDFDDMFV